MAEDPSTSPPITDIADAVEVAREKVRDSQRRRRILDLRQRVDAAPKPAPPSDIAPDAVPPSEPVADKPIRPAVTAISASDREELDRRLRRLGQKLGIGTERGSLSTLTGVGQAAWDAGAAVATGAVTLASPIVFKGQEEEGTSVWADILDRQKENNLSDEEKADLRRRLMEEAAGLPTNSPILNRPDGSFDDDAAEALRLIMRERGKDYDSAQAAVDEVPRDLADEALAFEAYKAAQEDGDTFEVGVYVNGAPVGDETITLSSNVNANRALAEKLEPGLLRTVLSLDLTDPEIQGVFGVPVTDERVLQVAFDTPEDREAYLRNIGAMKEADYPIHGFLPFGMAPDGEWFLDLQQMRTLAYSAAVAKLLARADRLGQTSPEDMKAIQEEARQTADKVIHRMRNLGVPVYGADPTNAFAEFDRGEGWRGRVVGAAEFADQSNVTAQAISAVGSILGFDLPMPADSVRTGMALTLPRLDVAGVIYMPDGTQILAGEEGFAEALVEATPIYGRYLGDNPLARGTDWFLRLSYGEGWASAYSMAMEDVIREHGTVAGYGPQIAAKALGYYGSKEHVFRVASRDTDMANVFMTFGNAFDVTTAAVEGGAAPSLATGAGFLVTLGAAVYDPDAITMLGPAAALAREVSRAAKYKTGLNAYDALARGGEAFSFGGNRGLRGLENLDNNLDTMSDEAVAQAVATLTQQSKQSGSGAPAILSQMAETEAVFQTVAELPAGGSNSSVEAFARKTEVDQHKYDAAFAALKVKLDKLNATKVKAAEVAYTASVRQAEHLAGQLTLMKSLLAQEEARLLALSEKIAANDDVDALNKFLTEIGRKPRSKELYKILEREDVQKLLVDAGLDPVDVLADLRGTLTKTVKSTGDAKADRAARKAAKAARTQVLQSFQSRISAALNASVDDRLTATQRALKPRVDSIRASARQAEIYADMAARGVKIADKTLRDEIAKVSGKKGLAAKGDIDALMDGVQEIVDSAVGVAIRRNTVEVQAQVLPKMRRAVHERYIKNLRTLVESANLQARQGLRQRQSVDQIFEDWRDRGATLDEIAADPGAARVLTQEPVLAKRVLDDIARQYPDPVARDRATMAMLTQQRFMREMMLDPDSRAKLYRRISSPDDLMTLNGWANSAEAVYWRLAGHAKTFLDEFSPDRTGFDVKVSKRISTNAKMAEKDFEGLKSDFDWLIQYGEDSDTLDGAFDLADRFVTVPDRYTVKTKIWQEIVLDSQVGRGTSILEDAVEALHGLYAVHAYARATGDEYPALLIALVKSHAPERLTEEQAALLPKVAGYFLTKLREAADDPDVDLWGRAGLAWIRDTLGKGYAHVEITKASGESPKSRALFYNTLMALSAYHKQNQRLANIVGPRFNHNIMRAATYLQSEGSNLPADLLTDFKVGDYVVDAKQALAFNEVINTPHAIAQPSIETNAGRTVSPVEHVGDVDRPRDPRLKGSGRRDFMLEQMLRDTNVGLEASQIVELWDKSRKSVADVKDATYAVVRDSAGDYSIRKVKDLSLRDPRISYLDALDGVLLYGVKPLLAERDAARLGDNMKLVRAEYQKLVAISANNADDLQFAPRDLVDALVDKLNLIEKDVTAAMSSKVRNATWQMIANIWYVPTEVLLRVFRQHILSGLGGHRFAMLSVTAVGDTTQMFLEIGRRGLDLGVLGTIGYVPIVGPYFQKQAARLYSGKPSSMPTYGASQSLHAILEKSDQIILGRDGKPLLDEFGRPMTAAQLGYEARMRGAGDNISTPDSIRALRQMGQETFNSPTRLGKAARKVYRTAADWMQAIERQVSRGTKAQRLLLYAEARMGGATPDEAEKLMKRALFDWSEIAGNWEKWLAGRAVLFYTLKKNAMAQVYRTLFEPFDIGIEEWARRYMRGETKVQRMELMSRLGYAPLMMDTRPDEQLSPEDMRAKADIQAMADYLEEYPLVHRSTLSDKQRDYMRRYMGMTNYEYARVLPKNPAAELIEFWEMTKLFLIGPAAVAMDAISGTDNFDRKAWMRACVEFFEDQATPIYAPLIRGFAEANNMITPYSQSDYGDNLTVDEMHLIWTLGLQDGLVPTENGVRYKSGNSLSGWMLKLLRRAALTEFSRARMLLAGVPGSEYVTPPLIRLIGHTLGWEEARIEVAASMPDRYVLTEMEYGKLRAKLEMWAQVMGVANTFFYGGRKNQMWEKENAKAWADLEENLDLKRSSPIRPGDLEVR